MKRLLLLLLVTISTTSKAAEGKGPLVEINFCYNHFREEIATAAVLTGHTQGYFAANGFKINFINDENQPYPASTVLNNSFPRSPYGQPSYLKNEIALVQKTLSGACDVSVVGADTFLFNKTNTGVHLLATYLYGAQYDTHLLVGAHSGVKSLADLRGKNIGIGRLATYILLVKALKGVGLSERDVRIVRDDPDVFSNKLAQNDFAAVIAYNPTTPLLIASGHAKILGKNLFGTYLKPFIPSSVLFSSDSVMKKKKVEIARFMEVFQKSAKRISKNPDDVIYALKSNEGNKLNYNFTKAEIEKAANLMQIGQPFYFDKTMQAQSNSRMTVGDVKASFDLYARELSALNFMSAKADLSFLDSNH